MATIVKSSPTFFSFAFAITIFIIFASPFSPAGANHTRGFSVNLIHRDSSASPFYNPSLTHFERVGNALRRSHERANYFVLASMSLEAASSEVIPDALGAYLMEITVGTPPFTILAIADTGSDLIWTQCAPCDKCYRENAALFNPGSSSTYKEVSCHTSQCQILGWSSCDINGTCGYSVSYNDGSYSRGVLATETISLGPTASFPGTTFGCGFDNDGTFNAEIAGIVGLGGGSASLISQTKSSIGGKFSYCLVPLSSDNSQKTDQMHFGDNAVVSGGGVVSTPFITNYPNTFYFLSLEGFTVGSQTLRFYNSSSSSPNDIGFYGNGNIIIDSGTTLTYLPLYVYTQLESAVKTAVRVEPVPDPLKTLNLCYKIGHDGITLPIITAHFTGADVRLNPLNSAFIRTSAKVACLAFAPTDNVAIFGNIAQTNFLVGYDLTKKTVSFKPTEC